MLDALVIYGAVMSVIEEQRKMAQSRTPRPTNMAIPRNRPTALTVDPARDDGLMLIAYASAAGFSAAGFVPGSVVDLYNDRVLTAPSQRTAVEIQARIAEASKPKKKELRKHDAHAMLDLEERKVEVPPPLPARPVELP